MKTLILLFLVLFLSFTNTTFAQTTDPVTEKDISSNINKSIDTIIVEIEEGKYKNTSSLTTSKKTKKLVLPKVFKDYSIDLLIQYISGKVVFPDGSEVYDVTEFEKLKSDFLYYYGKHLFYNFKRINSIKNTPQKDKENSHQKAKEALYKMFLMSYKNTIDFLKIVVGESVKTDMNMFLFGKNGQVSANFYEGGVRGLYEDHFGLTPAPEFNTNISKKGIYIGFVISDKSINDCYFSCYFDPKKTPYKEKPKTLYLTERDFQSVKMLKADESGSMKIKVADYFDNFEGKFITYHARIYVKIWGSYYALTPIFNGEFDLTPQGKINEINNTFQYSISTYELRLLLTNKIDEYRKKLDKDKFYELLVSLKETSVTEKQKLTNERDLLLPQIYSETFYNSQKETIKTLFSDILYHETFIQLLDQEIKTNGTNKFLDGFQDVFEKYEKK